MDCRTESSRRSLYVEVTERVIAELEEGRLPWVQRWDAAACGCAMPANAASGRRYSACASLAIRPTVRHADYVGSWLAVLRDDEKAIFRAASAASKAADYLLAFAPEAA